MKYFNPTTISIEGKLLFTFYPTPEPNPCEYDDGVNPIGWAAIRNKWKESKRTVEWHPGHIENLYLKLFNAFTHELDGLETLQLSEGVDMSHHLPSIEVAKICCQTGIYCGATCNGEESCLEYALLKQEEKTLPARTRNEDDEAQIESIRQRIADEQRKHHSIDWTRIAAKKIYANFQDQKHKESKRVETLVTHDISAIVNMYTKEIDELKKEKEQALAIISGFTSFYRPQPDHRYETEQEKYLKMGAEYLTKYKK